MASRAEIKKLISLSMTDDHFRSNLLKDPARASAAVGVRLSAREVKSVKSWGAPLNATQKSWTSIAECVATAIVRGPGPVPPAPFFEKVVKKVTKG